MKTIGYTPPKEETKGTGAAGSEENEPVDF